MDFTEHIIITFGSALFFGIIFIIISNKLKIPSIALLLIGGILLGSSGLQIVNPEYLGDGLKAIIQLAVALILFEGGLTLDPKGYRAVSSEIRRSLTIGVIITWGLSTAVVKFLFDFSLAFSLLSGSLIIVTGPTVIVPILKRLNVKKNIHSFLHWEGVLIDPVGVFIAMLCYEWIIGHNAVALFFLRILTGLVIGVSSGFILSKIINKQWISEESLNVFTLSCAVAIFVISDLIIPESGLMSVIIAGFVVGYVETPQIDNIKIYKAQLIDLLIGLLFILLSANLNIESYGRNYGLKMIIAVVIVMVAIRPVNIFVTTFMTKKFSLREKIFLSWIAPRGIVAASMASLFTINLKAMHFPEYASHYDFLEAFTYAVICGTVIIQGFSAKGLGRLLGVVAPKATGWLVIGAHNLGRAAAKFIISQGYSVTLVDTNMHSVKVAKREKLSAIAENALAMNPDDYPEIYDVGNVLAVTSNEDHNELACQYWKKKLHNPDLYRWRHPPGADESLAGEKEYIGIPIWEAVELDKIVSMDMTSDEIASPRRYKKPRGIRHGERILMYAGDKTIVPMLPDNTGGECTCLIFSPFDIGMDLSTKTNWILFSDAGNMTDALVELCNCIAEDYPDVDIPRLHKQLIDQEKEYSSVVGYEVALPHAYIDGIDDSIVLIAKMKNPVGCTFSDEKIRYIFLVLSPKDKPNTHIEMLAKISKFITSERNRNLLGHAVSREELVQVFFPEG